MNIKKLAIAGATSAIIFSSLAGMAFASTVPANFPGDTGTSCNAWHGAPGGFGPDSPYYFVRTDTDFGQEQGVITGQNNSEFSASCNQ
jgi:hypothetical protein